MANITRNFTAGRMNKVVDERLIPNGEYIDALNVRMGSTEKSEIGVIENAKGNLPITSLKYVDGTPLSSSARCIGAIEDSANETIYWFVHDNNFSVGATGKLDMIVSFNVYTNILTYHVISIDDGGGVNTTLNFDSTYLITGVDIIENLLFFTDDYNPPRFINRKRNYANPVGNIDQFSAESILVIKQPPIASPAIQPIVTGGQDNFMETRYICFAYRYRYQDNEYSATSQFSAPAFIPKPFEFSINSFLNEGMVNLANSTIITYNSGGPLVVGIDLLFKEAQSNTIRVIEKLDKSVLGLADNTDYTYVFTNSKIFTILPESEILRLYDNVPLLAKAQTMMGNRLMYGNYVEGYDLVDKFGQPVRFEYTANLVTESVDTKSLVDSTESSNYSINGPQTIPNSVLYFDLTGADLIAGSSISAEIRLSHNSFTGNTPFPTEQSENIEITFSFILNRDYTSVYDLATSVEFQEAVGTISNINPVYPSTPGGSTLTDQLNDALPMNLDALTKYSSGISAGGQPIAILTYPSSQLIGLQFIAMRYVNNTTTPTFNVYEYYSVVFAEVTYQKINSPRSLHSNRGYEIGIVYMDEYNRASTALVSPNNTVAIPCANSSTKNSIQVTIPPTQRAPYWAKRYKFVIKPDEENYDTIYSSIFFLDPLSNDAYFLLEGENARKVEQGDRLIVKADTGGPTTSCVYATVLEKEAKAEGFIEIPSQLDPNVNIPVPSGVYMKINPSSFAVVQDELSIIAPGTVQVDQNTPNQYPILNYNMNRYDTATSTWVDYDVPAGSRIKISFKFQRFGTGDGNNACEKRIYTLEKTLVSSASYPNMKDWWDGENVQNVITEGVIDVGAGGGTIDNTYISTLASSSNDIPTAIGTNYYRFYRNTSTNQLTLILSGTVRCGGVASANKRRSSIIANVEVFRADTTLIFETEPQDALPDLFFENNLSLGIDADGNHEGNVQDQDIALGQPAVIDTEFFNCFCFGNGAESYKIRDSIVGKTFNLGNRVTSVSAENYREADRFADITYSGVYNTESNVNKLNEFNLGLLNFKPLEQSFGPIYRMDGRETDILTLQEDKISYVLTGKNLLSDSTGGGVVASVPEVLGTQIARTEKYGISFNPESYVQWGYDRYFTDVKRGAVIQLKGNSYSNEQLRVVSESGMRTWFRDVFIESFNTQKLGGFDPYLNEYVLSTNNIELPVITECVNCGISQTTTIESGDSREYCVNVGDLVGDVIVNYEVPAESTGEFIVNATYNEVTVSSGVVSSSGFITVDKNSNSVDSLEIQIVATDNITIDVTVDCPIAEQLTIIEVCVTNDVEAGKFIHNEYRYTSGPFISPVQSNLVTFASGTSNPLVSRYNSITGNVGTGGFPPAGSTMRLASNKIGFDDFNFDVTQDNFRYYRSNVLYNNNPIDIAALLIAASEATPISGSSPYYYADFTVPSSGQYLYLIWDYRNALPIELCYSDVNEFDACCNCAGEEPLSRVTFSVCYQPNEESGRYYGFRASEPVDADISIDYTVIGSSIINSTSSLGDGNIDSFIGDNIVMDSYLPTIRIDSITPLFTGTQIYSTGIVDSSTNCTNCEPPFCFNSVLVFQVCNSNSAKDDNFDVYLNNEYIGALDLNYNAQVGSVFIASLDPTLTITAPDFVCPLNLMAVYRFDPSIVQANNVLELRNAQENNNGNYGLIGVRNYQISGTDLISPCTVGNFEYDGDTGQSFMFNFPYEACCPSQPGTIEIDLSTNINNRTVYLSFYSLVSGLVVSTNWGDGSPVTVGLYATHTYATAGNYTITISVNDRFNLGQLYINDYSSNGYAFATNGVRNLQDFTPLRYLGIDNLAFDITTLQKPINTNELYLSYPQEPILDLTSFDLCSYIEVIDSVVTTSIDVSGLTNLTNSLYISGNTVLTSINLSGLIYLPTIQIDYCSSLTTCPNLSSLSSLYDLAIYNTPITSISLPPAAAVKYVYLFGCALDQAGVDDVLVKVDAGGQTSGSIYTNGGTNAAPSALGLAAKASLISKGFTVVTN